MGKYLPCWFSSHFLGFYFHFSVTVFDTKMITDLNFFNIQKFAIMEIDRSQACYLVSLLVSCCELPF
jgi:hypothetical protein